MEKLTSLQLFEEVIINDIYIMRVPGGYIYSRRLTLENDKPAFSVFVPDLKE